MSHPFQTIEACSLMDPLPRSVVSLLHGEVRPTCSANGQKVAIIGTLTQYTLSPFVFIHSFVLCGLDSIPFYILSSAILYLNGDLEGGDFFFAKSMTDLMPDVRVKPRCGRLVGFSAGRENLHGVLGVTKGRCAIALWFTLSRPWPQRAHL